MDDALKAVSSGMHLLAQAPTGLGKTAVALAASIECAMRENKLVLFLTSRQSQHRIVVDTLRRIKERGLGVLAVDIVSKQAMCPQKNRPGNSAAFQQYCSLMTESRACKFFNRQTDEAVRWILSGVHHVQDMHRACATCGVCPHKAALEAASRAHVLICDYNYVFSTVRERILPRLQRRTSELILAVDEAHNLPDRIRGQLSGNLSVRQLMRGAKDAKSSDSQLAGILAGLSKALSNHLSKVRTERRVDRRLLMDLIDQVSAGGPWCCETIAEACVRTGEELAKNGANTVLLSVTSFLRTWNEANPCIVRLASGGPEGRIGYRLLDPSVLSRDVFRQVHSSILMSGTLHPGEMYADLLGLEKHRVLLRSYPSPFPPENRLTVATPHLTTSYHMRSDSMMQAIAAEISSIAQSTPGNLASFFPSYDLLARVSERLALMPLRKSLLVESQDWDKARRDEALTRLRELKENGGALLFGVLGGSFSEGIDFNDNLLSCVVIAGLPISPPTVEVRALDDYYSAKFGRERGYLYVYLYPALNKVMQAAGRCIRSESDRAVVVILDGRVLTDRYASHLPPGFKVRAVTDAQAALRTFFYGGKYGELDDSQAGSGGGAEARDLARAGGRGEAPRPEGLSEPAA